MRTREEILARIEVETNVHTKEILSYCATCINDPSYLEFKLKDLLRIGKLPGFCEEFEGYLKAMLFVFDEPLEDLDALIAKYGTT